MPWGVRDVHEQRVAFVVRAHSGREPLSALLERLRSLQMKQ